MTGSGTQADPYIIENVTDLQAIENNLTAYYELGGNIDASATSGWNGGLGFAPIGTPANPFTGQLDGKSYKITSLFINRPTEDYIGLLGYIETAGVVQNLGIEDCNITGVDYVGGLVGRNISGTITNCYTTGAVIGDNFVGGFAGHNWDDGVITKSYSTCTVTCDSQAGGFIGENDGTIQRCYATGNVTCTGTGVVKAAAGFVSLDTTTGGISDCYSRGDATSLLGRASGFADGSAASRCYSTGKPTGAEASGFCYVGGPFTACFWDTETSGKDTPGDYPPYGDVVGKTTAQMKTKSTFEDAGWDFTTPIWYIHPTINDGYPAFTGVVTRLKGNPNIDQLIYQHVERMGR